MKDATAIPLLEARGLSKSYRRRALWGRGAAPRAALEAVDLPLHRDRVLALVGKSAAGKSTLGRCLALLESADAGTVLHRGIDLTNASTRALRNFRGEVQLVHQDAARSFHPLWTARRVLEEPLRLRGESDRAVRAVELAGQVGLDGSQLERPARSLSGGQMRRLNLARALASQPELLILDEPFAGLDPSLKAQMAQLIETLRKDREFGCLYITHDLAMAALLADELAVLDRGRLVEHGQAREVLSQPRSEAARQLIVAAGMAEGRLDA